MGGTIDLHWSDPGSAGADPQIERSLGWLREDERNRHDRLVRDVDRRLFLLGRYLLRTALAARTGTAPASWTFPIAAHGRPQPAHPQVANAPDANLSHTEGLVVVAVADGSVGIDVERSDRRPPGRRPERFLTPAEIAQWQSAEESDRVRTFWRLWTLKEAWLKALGTGVAGGLQSGSVLLDRLEIDAPHDRRASLIERPIHLLGGEFCVGLAIRNRSPGAPQLTEHPPAPRPRV